MPLSPEDLRRYFNQGYLVLPNFFPVPVIEKMAAEIEQSMADASVFEANRAYFNFAYDEASSKYYVLQALNSENLSSTIRDTLKSSEIQDLVGSILGPDINLFQAKLVFKKAQGGAEVPWHQDFDYWKQNSKAPLHLNFGIYLDDTDQENGCLEVIPQSHGMGLMGHRNQKEALNFPIYWNTHPDEKTVIPIEGKKGTVILFSALTAHHSKTNNSSKRRLFLNLVFSPAGNELKSGKEVARKAPAFDMNKELEINRVPAIWGPGPHGGQCASQYLTRELWKLAIVESEPDLEGWVYIHSNQASDTAPEWFTARRNAQTRFVHLRNGNENKDNVERVHFLTGDLMDALFSNKILNVLSENIGILVIQSHDYSLVKHCLTHLEHKLVSGSVVVLEAAFEGENWKRGAVYALVEYAKKQKLSLKYLGRTDRGLTLKLESTSNGYHVSYNENLWQGKTQGILSGFGIPSAPKSQGFENPLKRLKKVLRPLREDAFPSPYFKDFFPRNKIPHFKGGDTLAPCCGTHLRRKELWKYALSFVTDPKLAWCEFGVGEGESLDWFALQKPKENLLFGFDSFEGIPEAWASSPKGQWKSSIYAPNRKDVKIVAGLYDQSFKNPEVVATLGKRLGFIHIDCDLYSSTKIVFQSLKNLIGPGTVIVFDEFYGYWDWEKHEAKAFFEMAQDRNFEFEYLGRSDLQIALRVVAVGTRWSCAVRKIAWRPSGNGIRFDHGEDLFLGYSMRRASEYPKIFLKRIKQRGIKV